MSGTVIAPGSYTADQTVGVSSVSGHGQPEVVAFFIDITDLQADTPSITVSIGMIDIASGKTINILTSALLSTVASTILRIGPELGGSANLVAQDIVPENMEVFVDHTDAKPITYSIGLIHG